MLAFKETGIKELEDGFLLDYPQLWGFAIGNNPIAKLRSATFHGAENLTRIEIYHTRLDEVGDAFHGMKKIQTLLLNDNLITTINATTFSGMASLVSLGLEG